MARNNLWLTLAGIPQKPQEGPSASRRAPELGALDSNSPRSLQLSQFDALSEARRQAEGHWIDNSPGGRQQSTLRDMPAYEKAAHWGNIGLGIAAGGLANAAQQPLAQAHEQNLARNSPAFQQYLSESPGNPHIGGVTSNHALTAQQNWLRQQAEQAGLSFRTQTLPEMAEPWAASHPPAPSFSPFERGSLSDQEAEFRYGQPGMHITDERNPTPESITNPYRDYNVSSISRLGRREDSEGRRILADLSVTRFLNKYKPNTGNVNRDDMRQAIWDQIPGSLPASERGGSRDEPQAPQARDPRVVYPWMPDDPTRMANNEFEFGPTFSTYTHRDPITKEETERQTSASVPGTRSMAARMRGPRSDYFPLYSQSHKPGQWPGDAMPGRGKDPELAFTPKHAIHEGSRFIDAEFPQAEDLIRNKELLHLDEPLAPDIEADLLTRMQKVAPRLKAAGNSRPALDILTRNGIRGADQDAAIGALRSGTFPTGLPARVSIDLLNALWPGNNAGNRYFRDIQGYHGGSGNARGYLLPQIPRMPKTQGLANRKYHRLWDTPPQP